MTGKIYMPLRATQRETCEGTSDNVVMPMDEFRRTIDGAVRIARQVRTSPLSTPSLTPQLSPSHAAAPRAAR